MPTLLYGGLPYDKFALMARKAVVEHWNGDKALTKKFGKIDLPKVFIVWQVKAIQNSKALLGVSVEGDGMYYEATWNGDEQIMYLDVYVKKEKVDYSAKISGVRVSVDRLR